MNQEAKMNSINADDVVKESLLNEVPVLELVLLMR